MVTKEISATFEASGTHWDDTVSCLYYLMDAYRVRVAGGQWCYFGFIGSPERFDVFKVLDLFVAIVD